jgi:predicted CopG family antitoxin
VLRKKLDATKEAFTDDRVRWLIGKKRQLLESGATSEETLNKIIHELMKDEVERHLILAEIEREESLSAEKIAELIDLPSEKVRDHLKVLRFLNEVSVKEVREGVASYSTSPILKEERRRCPCEALIDALLEKTREIEKSVEA